MFHRYGYIYRPHRGDSWLSAPESWKLTDTEILKAIACVHPKFLLGSRSGNATRFAVIDIDAGSKYHNKRSLHRILSLLSSAGLKKSVLYRSSFSDGWHLYIFFAEPINTVELRRQLLKLFVLNNYTIAKGTLEIFPNRTDQSMGMGLRLPLQPGWAWLDTATLDVMYDRAYLEPTKALELFLDDLNAEANTYFDYDKFRSYIGNLAVVAENTDAVLNSVSNSQQVLPIVPTKISELTSDTTVVNKIFGTLPPGINLETWSPGSIYYQNGLTGASQRADAIFCLSHFLFYGDPSKSLPALGYGCEDERQLVITRILSLKHNDQSKDINKGRSDAFDQAQRCAQWVPPHKRNCELRPYEPKRPISWVRHNTNLAIEARKRIKNAVDELSKEGRAFSIRTLMASAKCGQRTLYRHQDLWMSIYNQAQQGCFAAVSGEYNVVLGTGSSETRSCNTSEPENMPLGLLAARQIAAEVKMRVERTRAKRIRLVSQVNARAEKRWQQNFAVYLSPEPSQLSAVELKQTIVAIRFLRQFAPSDEDLNRANTLLTSFEMVLEDRQSQAIVLATGPPG